MIHKGKLGDKDTAQCVIAIRKNCVECMQGVLHAMPTFEISLGLAENAPRMQVMSNVTKCVFLCIYLCVCVCIECSWRFGLVGLLPFSR